MILFTHSVQHNRSSKNNLTKNAIINISYVSKYTNEQSENRHLPTKKNHDMHQNSPIFQSKQNPRNSLIFQKVGTLWQCCFKRHLNLQCIWTELVTECDDDCLQRLSCVSQLADYSHRCHFNEIWHRPQPDLNVHNLAPAGLQKIKPGANVMWTTCPK